MNESEILYSNAQSHEDDKRLFVQFSLEPRIDQIASEKEQRNIYKDVEFVTIRIPGDKTLTVHRPVRPADKSRFAFQYQAFKNKLTDVAQMSGVPLAMWPLITPAQIRELEYFNVRTVEQLAELSDNTSAGQMMGIQKLKHAAKAYLVDAKEKAPLVKMQKELEQRDNQIAALQDAVNKLVANAEKANAKNAAK